MKEEDVVFKGTKNGLTLFIKEDMDLALLQERILDKLNSAGNFFEGAEVQLDVAGLSLSEDEVEAIKTMIESFGLIFDGVVTHTELKKTELSRTEVMDMTNSLLVKKTLRSGQRLNYDGNIIIMGDVNPGAEVIAAGDIIVLGRLRGVAHAGALGNQEAIVMAFQLQPIQLRIAQYITRSPDNEEISLAPDSPEIARVKDGLVMIEAY